MLTSLRVVRTKLVSTNMIKITKNIKVKSFSHFLIALRSFMSVNNKKEMNKRFPKYLEGRKYKLDYELRTVKTTYRFGIYKDQAGKKYIAKTWFGNKKDREYLEIVNEFNFYNFISDNETIFNKAEIYTPKFYSAYLDEGIFMILLDYVNGKQMYKLNDQIKIAQSLSIIDKMKNVHDDTPLNKLSDIKKTNILSFKLKYLTLMFALFVKRRISISNFVYIIKTYLSLHGSLGNKSKWSIILSDLNSANILVSKDKTYLIDFQLAGVFMMSLELSNLYYRYSNNLSVLKLIKTNLKKNKINIKEFKFMLLYSMLSDMLFNRNRKIPLNLEMLNIQK